MEVKEAQNWIQVEKKDTLGFLITIQPNETDIDRYATIRLFSVEKEELLKFAQLGDKEIIAGLAFDYREQTQWIDASSKFTRLWSAKVNSEADSWAYATRHGDDGIMLNLDKNEQRTKRTLKLIIHDADKVLAALLVNQYPDPLPLSTYGYSVGDKASIITLDSGVKDSLIFQLPDWIQIHSKQETDNGIRYQFAIENNPMDIARYDSIRIRTESETGQSEIAISAIRTLTIHTSRCRSFMRHFDHDSKWRGFFLPGRRRGRTVIRRRFFHSVSFFLSLTGI